MKAYQKKEEEISFVAIGNFNPAIFHPEWFIRHDLVPEVELTEPYLTMKVIHPEVCNFSTWFSLEVVTSRLVLSTTDMSRADDLKDLAANIFSILNQTPVTGVGFNKTFIMSCSSVDAWHKIGHALAPKTLWLKAMPQANDDMSTVGMKSLDIAFNRWDSYPGGYNINIFPSNYLPSNPEATLKVNNHIDYNSYLKTNPDTILHGLILEYWESYLNLADEFFENITRTVDECEL